MDHISYKHAERIERERDRIIGMASGQTDKLRETSKNNSFLELNIKKNKRTIFRWTILVTSIQN